MAQGFASSSGIFIGRNVTQVEVDFGSTPLSQKIFTISDSSATTTSYITASVAYDAPTGKDLDELEMDSIVVICGNCTNGTFDMVINTSDGSYLADKFKINYIIN